MCKNITVKCIILTEIYFFYIFMFKILFKITAMLLYFQRKGERAITNIPPADTLNQARLSATNHKVLFVQNNLKRYRS